MSMIRPVRKGLLPTGSFLVKISVSHKKGTAIRHKPDRGPGESVPGFLQERFCDYLLTYCRPIFSFSANSRSIVVLPA